MIKQTPAQTMYIQIRCDSLKFKGCSPLRQSCGLIKFKTAIAYYAYTHRLRPV